MLSELHDIAIVGSGFAGSLLAMIARRLGRSVILLEKNSHPRVVMGESSTPLTNLLLDDIASRYGLPRIAPFAKWGSWQKAYPEIACGLKRGFTFYHHDLQNPRPGVPGREHQLLVEASPHDGIADAHWYRAHLDERLVEEAQTLGSHYVDQVTLDRPRFEAGEVKLTGSRAGLPLDFRARFLVDGTGPRGFLHQTLNLGDLSFPRYPRTQALYSHFSEVGLPEYDSQEATPYPVDDAAVHHVFDGGWIWVLRFNNGITSAGVVAEESLAKSLRLEEGAIGWKRLLRRLPFLETQFESAQTDFPFRQIPELPFRSATVTGRNWAMLPSAAGFVDPLLSTGFPLTLLGVTRLAGIIERDWDSPRFATSLTRYGAQTDGELLAAARLVGALHANLNCFPVFTAISMIYFATASFAETARRLNKPELASSFLLHDHPEFGPVCRHLLGSAHGIRTKTQAEQLINGVRRAIEPFNVAGLCDSARRNWYPVNAEDLLASARKLGVDREDIAGLLDRSGFYSATYH